MHDCREPGVAAPAPAWGPLAPATLRTLAPPGQPEAQQVQQGWSLEQEGGVVMNLGWVVAGTLSILLHQVFLCHSGRLPA